VLQGTTNYQLKFLSQIVCAVDVAESKLGLRDPGVDVAEGIGFEKSWTSCGRRRIVVPIMPFFTVSIAATIVIHDGKGSLRFLRNIPEQEFKLIPKKKMQQASNCSNSDARIKPPIVALEWGKIWSDFEGGLLRPVLALSVAGAAILVSYSQRLGIEKEMAISIARAFIQLSIIGFVLEFIFNQSNVAWIFVAYISMVSVAGYTAGRRARHVPNGGYISGLSIFVGTSLTLLMLVACNVFPFTPRYIIPIAGMMVGNSMGVTGVTLRRMQEDMQAQQGLIETALALGATPRQATLKQVQRALIVGLSPTLDNAKTVGLISLPGAMTGLIMGGASPMLAIQLQIVVMNMLLGASTFSGVLATFLSWPFFFTKSYQLETKVLIAD
jgi:putative ABC transport system permease protein